MGHIWLIGMMGSGKTSVGRRSAEVLKLPFIDSDDEVVALSGTSIETLFSEGEGAFRAVERDVIAEIATSGDSVVATGGGAVLDRSNVEAMRSSGTTILLDTDLHTLATRLAGSKGRPLLTAGGDIASIAHDRATAYSDAADVVIVTTDQTIDEVVEEVLACVPM
jgi:shikimate kinase